ncbi:hypothetical protein CNMCM5793_008751 [Aspergillus hiratsukae]|uniref:F-box domain-containing protein n=1 Tax=Aspergillus hiratsukae TaxID=1194566 RepID=A0A8H6P0H3_9EURO|nr:hypothetical protein CNMCM5793_008751 [Aspergillus hiratsukae]KAF7157983.1 hypothetical protein CNMCM6106_004272 [Aspergillus hiratsukae]
MNPQAGSVCSASNSENAADNNFSPISMLPPECLVNVLENLDTADNLSVSHVSRDMRTWAKPLIFRDILWTYTAFPFRRVLRLLEQIFLNPQIAWYVKHLQLTYTGPAWVLPDADINFHQHATRFAFVTEKASEFVREMGLFAPEEFVGFLRQGNYYAYAAVLIFQLHNLRSLELDYTLTLVAGFPGMFLHQALRTSFEGISKFKRLEVLKYGGDVPQAEELDDEAEEAVAAVPGLGNKYQFAPWLALPKLRHVEMWLRSASRLEGYNYGPVSSELESLVLARSSAGAADIKEVLSACPKLRRLHLGVCYNLPSQLVLFDSKELVDALKPLKDRLETLSIGLETDPSFIGGFSWDQDNNFGNPTLTDPFLMLFREFTKLQELEVPMPLLLGWFSNENWEELPKYLPPKVRHVVLRNDLSGFDNYAWDPYGMVFAVDQTIVETKKSIPSLERVTLRVWETNPRRPNADFLAEAADMAQSVGVQCDLVVDELGSGLWVASAT